MGDAGRREFLSGAGFAAATLFLPRSARAADSRIEVLRTASSPPPTSTFSRCTRPTRVGSRCGPWSRPQP